ncbi:hypothetical protein BASA84_000119 [Batrachochytrium salamandrivorans]|nr:hypothetical protein BASA84_000119 [Batrachochytrium salamandrivorans]
MGLEEQVLCSVPVCDIHLQFGRLISTLVAPDIVVCGRADGHITVWNVQSALRIDNIMPDPEWMHSKMESNLLA